MYYTEEEICRAFDGAKNRNRQIAILAQLNDVGKKTIREILKRHGRKLPREVHYTVYAEKTCRDCGGTFTGANAQKFCPDCGLKRRTITKQKHAEYMRRRKDESV